MFRRNASSRRRAHGEQQYVTNWTAVFAAGAIGLTVLLGFLGMLTLNWSPPEKVQAPATPSRSEIQEQFNQLDHARMVAKPHSFRRTPDEFIVPPQRPAADILIVRRPADATVGHFVAAWNSVWGNATTQAVATPRSVWQAAETPPEPEVVATTTYTDSLATAEERQEQTEVDSPLAHYLVNRVPELKLEDVKGTSQRLFETTSTSGNERDMHSEMLRTLAHDRADLRGLPFLADGQCTSDGKLATQRGEFANYLRRFTGPRFRIRLHEQRARETFASSGGYIQGEIQSEPIRQFVTDQMAADYIGEKVPAEKWKHPEQAAILQQMLQCEGPAHRRLLVNWLSQIEGPEASEALARRAVFDFDPRIRSAASEALRDRPAKEYEPVLNAGLNYPFSPVVGHAKEAFEIVHPASPQAGEQTASPPQEKSAVSQAAGSSYASDAPNESVSANAELQFQQNEARKMAKMLVSASHTSAPYYKSCEDTWMVDELVKVNHLQSCVLCHPASHSKDDSLRGQIPTPGEPLPQVYYNSQRGNFVRADVVYLRQDFSVMLPVEKPDKWPKMQRYDFFIRTRPATPDDRANSRVEIRRQLHRYVHASMAKAGEEAKLLWATLSGA